MKSGNLEISSDLLARRRVISFVATWVIALVSLFIPDLTWVHIPSFVDFMLFAGAGMSVVLSFTLLARHREFSTAQPLALMSSALTATAAMVAFVSLHYLSTTRMTLLSLCMIWQLFATFLELKIIVDRGKSNVAQKTQ